MEERRRCTSLRQLELLVEFLEHHRDLALGRVRSKEARAFATRLWCECAEILNAEGPARTGKEWSKVWNDYKCKIRAKLVTINASQRGTGGGPSNAPNLTNLEERVANILGRDVGPLPNVRQDPFVSDDGCVVEEVVQEEVVEERHERQNVSQSIILHTIPEDTPPRGIIQGAPPVEASPTPSESGQVPPLSSSTVPRIRERRRAQRASRQPAAQTPAQSNRNALNESRLMILEIERMRAEAALKTAEATSCFAQSFQLIAQSIDRFSKKYCQQQASTTGVGAMEAEES